MIPASLNETGNPGSFLVIQTPQSPPYAISLTVAGHTLRVPITKRTAEDLQGDSQSRLRATEGLIRIAHAAR
jgi:hypothetical protein